MGEALDRLREVTDNQFVVAPVTLTSLQANGTARYSAGTLLSSGGTRAAADVTEYFSDRAGPFGSQPFWSMTADSSTLTIDPGSMKANVVLHSWSDQSFDVALRDQGGALSGPGPAAGSNDTALFVITIGAPSRLPDSLHFHRDLTFESDVPVGGWADLTLHADGAWNFSGYLHDSGATSYDMGVAWVVKSGGSSNTAYSFSETGHVHGSFEAGSPDLNWDKSGTNDAIKADWMHLVSSHRDVVQLGASLDIGPLVDDAVKAMGVVSAVVAVVA
jgi:hypothetical protein